MRAIILALAVLIATAAPSFVQDAAAQAPATATPNARVFNGGAGLILVHDQGRQHGRF